MNLVPWMGNRTNGKGTISQFRSSVRAVGFVQSVTNAHYFFVASLPKRKKARGFESGENGNTEGMKRNVVTKSVSLLSKSEFESLLTLNKGYRGAMHGYLLDFHNEDDNEAFAVMVKDGRGRIVAWSLVFDNGAGDKYEAHFFTRDSHRKRGLGRLLVEEVSTSFGRVLVYPNTQEGHDFFRSFGNKLNISTEYL